MKKLLLSLFGIALAISPSFAQCGGGGTGVDGAYSATLSTTLAGGTYNYTTFNIDAGVTVTVTGSQPLIIYCTGAATINGSLLANGQNGADGVTFSNAGLAGLGVAGGGNGGDGTYSSSVGPLPGVAGSGPGGAGNQGGAWSGGGGAGYALMGGASGNPSGGMGGPSYGTIQITGMEPGSGGGGGSGGYECGAGGGGGGGGFLMIQSAVSISIGSGGMITVNGGNGGSDGTGNCGGGGGGSGGAIWLSAPAFTHNGSLMAIGGNGGASEVPGSPYYGDGATGSVGRIRLDYNGTMSGSGTTSPAVGHHAVVSTLATAAVVTQNVSCFGGSDGAALATIMNGNAPYTGQWLPTGGTSTVATGLAAGTYTFTATDASGCTSSSTVTITEPTPINVTITTTPATCFGSADGTATGIVSGGTPGYTYSWMPAGGNSSTTTGLTAGCYTLVVTDMNGCTAAQTACITEPTQLQAVSTTLNVTCHGQCNGAAAISMSGGTPGYTYMWMPGGQTTSSISNLCAGCYTVTVVDANGCIYTESICVTQPPAPTPNLLGNDTLICDSASFSLCAPSGFTAYLWNTGSTLMCINADSNFCYSVQMMDVMGCVTMDTLCVTESTCLGIAESDVDHEILFPNPTTGVITIHHGQGSLQRVEVMDAQGRICLVKDVADDGELDLSGLADGVYTVSVNNTKHRLVIAR